MFMNIIETSLKFLNGTLESVMVISRNCYEPMNIIQFLIGHNNKKKQSDWADHGSEHIGVGARAVLRGAVLSSTKSVAARENEITSFTFKDDQHAKHTRKSLRVSTGGLCV